MEKFEQFLEKYCLPIKNKRNFPIETDKLIDSVFNSINDFKEFLKEKNVYFGNIFVKHKMVSRKNYLKTICKSSRKQFI